MAMVAVVAVLIVNMLMGRTGSNTFTRGNLHEGQLKLGENTREDFLLIVIQIATGLLLDDLKVVDEHPRGLEVHFGFSCGGMGHLSEAEGSLLGIHHDKFDEALGEIGGVGGLLDFGHGIIGS